MSLQKSGRFPTPVVADRAKEVAEPGLPVEEEFAETLGPSANVRDVRFEPGMRFKLGELTVELPTGILAATKISPLTRKKSFDTHCRN